MPRRTSARLELQLPIPSPAYEGFVAEIAAVLRDLRSGGCKIYGFFHSSVGPTGFLSYTWNPVPGDWDVESVVRLGIDCENFDTAREILNRVRQHLRGCYREMGSSLDPELPAVIYDVTRL